MAGEESKSSNIVFVSDRSSFIIKSIMKNLTALGYNCIFTELSVANLTKIREDIEGLVYLYIDELANLDRMGCTYLRDLCAEGDHSLYIMGNREDIDHVMADFFKGVSRGEFERPINVNQLTDEILFACSAESEKMRQRHILVVDDSGAFLNTMKEWLGGRYRLTLVNSALNAITFLAKERPDLILLDYEMPVCTGAQFLEMIRNDTDNGDVPVIFLTGKSDEASVKSVLALKPAGYLLKSLPRETIMTEIDKFFKKQKMLGK
ncbi:MAG: response regulator [Lachnospiraceae bacterium]|nr:response regulator [Lachnospiraceae bacterium]